MTSSKHPSFRWILVYFGVVLKSVLIQTSRSPLLADHYRGEFMKMFVMSLSLEKRLFSLELVMFYILLPS